MAGAAQTAAPSRGQQIAVWILSGLLTMAFLGAGGSKLAGVQSMVENFARWGYPSWFIYVTGAIEVACAVGLWIPRLRALAPLGLMATMLGAIATHLKTPGEMPNIVGPLILFTLAASVAYLRRGELKALLGRGA